MLSTRVRLVRENSWICFECRHVVQYFVVEDITKTQEHLQVFLVVPDEDMKNLLKTLGLKEAPISVAKACKHDRFFWHFCQQWRAHRYRIDRISSIIDNRLVDIDHCIKEWKNISQECGLAEHDKGKKREVVMKVLDFKKKFHVMLNNDGLGEDEQLKQHMELMRLERDYLMAVVPKIKEGMLKIDPQSRERLLKIIKLQSDKFEAKLKNTIPGEWTVTDFYDDLKAACDEADAQKVSEKPADLPAVEMVSTRGVDLDCTPDAELVDSPGVEFVSPPEVDLVSSQDVELHSAQDVELQSSPSVELISFPDVELVSSPSTESSSSLSTESASLPDVDLASSPDVELVSSPDVELVRPEIPKRRKRQHATKPSAEPAVHLPVNIPEQPLLAPRCGAYSSSTVAANSETLFIDIVCLLKLFSSVNSVPRKFFETPARQPEVTANPVAVDVDVAMTNSSSNKNQTDFRPQMAKIDLHIRKLERSQNKIFKSMTKIRKILCDIVVTESETVDEFSATSESSESTSESEQKTDDDID